MQAREWSLYLDIWKKQRCQLSAEPCVRVARHHQRCGRSGSLLPMRMTFAASPHVVGSLGPATGPAVHNLHFKQHTFHEERQHQPLRARAAGPTGQAPLVDHTSDLKHPMPMRDPVRIYHCSHCSEIGTHDRATKHVHNPAAIRIRTVRSER